MNRRRELCAFSGFTLVELIVVIVVLSMVAAVAVPKFIDHGNRARMTAYVTHTQTLKRVIQQYELDVPNADPDLTYTINSANFAASLLASRLENLPMKAFGGEWEYIYSGPNAGGNTLIRGVGLRRIGAFPSAGVQLLAFAQDAYAYDSHHDLEPESPEYHVVAGSGGWTVYDYPSQAYSAITDNKLEVRVMYWH